MTFSRESILNTFSPYGLFNLYFYPEVSPESRNRRVHALMNAKQPKIMRKAVDTERLVTLQVLHTSKQAHIIWRCPITEITEGSSCDP